MLAEMFETESLLLETFETEEALKKWRSINGGKIELSEDRSKLGTKSLKWIYEKDSVLKLMDYPALARLNEAPGAQGVKFWIYSQNSVDGDLTVKIGKESLVAIAPAYQFRVHMDFKGWRAVWIRVNVSAQTPATHVMADMDSLQIELPLSMEAGVLYLDGLEVMGSVSYLLCSDFQLPYLPTWATGTQYAAYCRIPKNAGATKYTEEHRKAFQTISERLDQYLLPQGTDFSKLDPESPMKMRYETLQEVIRESIAKYDSYRIHRATDGTLKGPGLLASGDRINYACVRFRDFEQIWAALALDYKMNRNGESREKLMTLFDFFYDQGWAEGSACGAMRFDEIRADGYAYAVYMMRKELAETGRLERETATLRWRSEFGSVFTYEDPELSSITKLTCDVIRSTVVFQFLSVMSMEDSSLKVFYMQRYIEYLQRFVMRPKGGIENGIKMDYTFWNHQGPYMSAYGLEALNVLCQLKYFLHGTCFDLDPESTDVLNQSLLVYRASSNKLDLPLRLRGRFQGRNGTMIPAAASYAFMAACGNREMERIFLDLWDITDLKISERLKSYLAKEKALLPNLGWTATLGQVKLYTDLLCHAGAEGVAPAPAMSGGYVFPYGGYFIYRRDDWMFAVSGWSCYIWDYENGTNMNLYGRYMNYGSATVVPQGGFLAGGIDTLHGWDWNRWPGATTKHLLEPALRNNEEMRFQAMSPFLGGVVSQNGNSVYAMQLHDAHFDPTFRAKKSWFCFEEEIVCLGSDICSDDEENEAETTLFQCVTEERHSNSLSVNGEEIPAVPYQAEFYGEKQVWLADPCGNGYLIPDGETLRVTWGIQESKTSTGVESVGKVAAAYFSHGAKPCRAGYEYVIFPEKKAEPMHQAAERLRYTVLQKDEKAHAVECRSCGAIGYAVFETDVSFRFGVLERVDTPCVVMETKLENGEIRLNVADPDLRLCEILPSQKGKKCPHRLTLVLSGHFDAVPCSGLAERKTDGANTILTLDCIDGKQVDLQLSQCGS